MLSEKPTRDKPIRLIHHAAQCDHHYAPSSLAALAHCLELGADKIEIDVIPLGDASFALLHDPDLGRATNGEGNAVALGRQGVENLFYRLNGSITDEKVGFVEGALDLLGQYPKTRVLQLDFKPYSPLTREVVEQLLKLIEPVRDRVQISSVADWAVRALRRAEPDLALGFDPLLYLDLVDDQPRPENIPPFRVGAYGLLDDHPLSAFQWGNPGAYFAARAETLLAQVPINCQWYIRADVLKIALEAGFDWIGFLHQHGSLVDAWTIDTANPEHIHLANQLAEQGIDELTTDTPSQLANLIDSDTII